MDQELKKFEIKDIKTIKYVFQNLNSKKEVDITLNNIRKRAQGREFITYKYQGNKK